MPNSLAFCEAISGLKQKHYGRYNDIQVMFFTLLVVKPLITEQNTNEMKPLSARGPDKVRQVPGRGIQEGLKPGHFAEENFTHMLLLFNKYFKIKVDVMNTPYFSVVLLQRFAWQIEIAMVDHARDVKKDLALC